MWVTLEGARNWLLAVGCWLLAVENFVAIISALSSIFFNFPQIIFH
jgi:hypothetical protein